MVTEDWLDNRHSQPLFLVMEHSQTVDALALLALIDKLLQAAMFSEEALWAIFGPNCYTCAAG